jgi:hypothetical protein
MSLNGFNLAPLNPDDSVAGVIRERLRGIMAPGPELADEYALIDLVDDVADACHLGKIDLNTHDVLVAEIKEQRMTLR